MEKITKSKIIKVKFLVPVTGMPYENYFGSLSAIYEKFTPDQVGCKLQALWDAKIGIWKPKVTSKCVISKHYIYRKQRDYRKKR